MLPGNEYFAAHQRIEAAPAAADGWDQYAGTTYAPDRMIDEALGFVRENADRPFFLYFASIVPHVAIQVPGDSLAQYSGQLDEEPYLGQRGYLPHPEPRAGYAAMVTRMDGDFGRILDLLDELGIADNTIVMFSSDNGPTFNGGSDSEFFDSAAGLRGLKTELYEGGIKVPMIARWPGRIAAGTTSSLVSTQWDVLPTVLELAALPAAAGIDGISFAPELLADGEQTRHSSLYWELGRQQAYREGDWKIYRRADSEGQVEVTELFNLALDPNETTDLAASEPERLAQMLAGARAARTPSDIFPSVWDE